MDGLAKKDLKRLLATKENFDCLEDVIVKNSVLLLKNYQTHNFNPGDKITNNRLEECCGKVESEVNSFLGVNYSMPSISRFSLLQLNNPDVLITLGLYANACYAAFSIAQGVAGQPLGDAIAHTALYSSPYFIIAYFMHKMSRIRSSYNPLFRSISISPLTFEADVPPTVAHEYTHYIQHKSRILPFFSSTRAFQEGHARGVERHFAVKWAHEESNSAISFVTLLHSLSELVHGYIWVGKELKKQPSKPLESMLDTIFPLDRIKKKKKIGNYQLGTSILSISEEKYGVGIYNKLIHGDPSPLKI